MSITTTNVKNEYTVAAPQTAFAFTFRWFSLDEIEVRHDGVLLVKDTDYTFSGTTSTQTGGQVDLTVSVDSGVLQIKRVTPVTQDADYGTTTVFPATTAQGVDDRVVAMIQEIVDVTVSTPEFPVAEADKFIGWNAGGTALENKTIIDEDKYEQLDTDVTKALADSATALSTANTAKNTAESAQLDADSAKANALAALAKANTNESDLATTEAKASSALSLATNNAADIAAIDTTDFVKISTNEPRMVTLEAESAATKVTADTNANDLIDVKSDVLDVQEELASMTEQYEQYIGNNVLIATELNGMSLNKVENPFAYITINGFRKTDSFSSNFTIQLYAFWDEVGSVWKVGRLSSYYDDVDGITFDITTVGDVGTVVYTSSNIAGATYDGHAYYKADKLLR